VGVNIFFFLKRKYYLVFKSPIKLDNNIVYFLHIGKAGGTILKSIFSNNKIQKNKIKVIGVSEKFKIYQLHPDQKYIFSIRNPITRYFSAFHARKIKSDIWTKEYYSVEGFGFYLYNDANQLAEDLYSKNLIKVFLSHISIRCIPIINENIYSWFNIEDLKKNLPQFIFENSTINEDWKFFSTKFGFEQNEFVFKCFGIIKINKAKRTSCVTSIS
jgi:hypothetical protein